MIGMMMQSEIKFLFGFCWIWMQFWSFPSAVQCTDPRARSKTSAPTIDKRGSQFDDKRHTTQTEERHFHSLQCLVLSSSYDGPVYHQIWWVRPQVVKGNHDHKCRLSGFGSHLINQLILAFHRSSFLRTPSAETYLPVHSVGLRQWLRLIISTSETQSFNFQLLLQRYKREVYFGGLAGAS